MAKKQTKIKVTPRMCLEHGIGYTTIVEHLVDAENAVRAGGTMAPYKARENLGAVWSIANNMKRMFPPSAKTAEKLIDGIGRTIEKVMKGGDGSKAGKLVQDIRKLRVEALNLYSEAKIACRNGSPLWGKK